MRTRALAACALSLAVILLIPHTPAYASTSVGTVSPESYAWGENMGWVNLAPSDGGLSVTDSAITGYAWSSVAGWINFNPTNSGQGVVNTPEGVLSGSAWVAGLGWLDMSGVTIDSSGRFTGTAGAEDSVGRVSFDCDRCDAETDWRPLSARSSAPATSPAAGSHGSVGISSTPSSGPPTSPPAQPGTPALDTTLHALGLPPAPAASATHVESYEQPLLIQPTQTGRVVKTAGPVSAVVEVPLRPGQPAITLSIDIQPTPLDATIGSNYLVGGVEFDIIARDSSGAEVHHFDPPITITLAVPEPLQGTGIGVYWFDESARAWTPVPGVTYAASSVSFSVDHLSRFAIFKEGGATPRTSGFLSFLAHSYIWWLVLVLAVLALFFIYRRRRV